MIPCVCRWSSASISSAAYIRARTYVLRSQTAEAIWIHHPVWGWFDAAVLPPRARVATPPPPTTR